VDCDPTLTEGRNTRMRLPLLADSSKPCLTAERSCACAVDAQSASAPSTIAAKRRNAIIGAPYAHFSLLAARKTIGRQLFTSPKGNDLTAANMPTTGKCSRMGTQTVVN